MSSRLTTPLTAAWDAYHAHHLKGTRYDYAAFEDAVRPLWRERDALTAELTEVRKKNRTLLALFSATVGMRRLPQSEQDKIMALMRAQYGDPTEPEEPQP